MIYLNFKYRKKKCEFMRSLKSILNTIFNHECWFVCKHCGCEYDVRRSNYCDTCGCKN